LKELRPSVVVLAGPNGAGKSTAAPSQPVKDVSGIFAEEGHLIDEALALAEFRDAERVGRARHARMPNGRVRS